MAQTGAAAVRKQIVVEAPIERAFTVSTGRFGNFKPPEHNLLGAPVAESVFEPRVGGGIVDRATDISPRWTIETAQARTSEVEVRFGAETPRAPRPRASSG